jgi:perosamine synthetase
MKNMADRNHVIPVSQPYVSEQDKKAVQECLDKGYLSGDAPIVGEFERNFADLIGTKFGVALANGSVALDLALHVLDLKPGDEVIVPSFTIASCLFAILRTGATPVFVDCEEETWNMSIRTVAEKVNSNTKAIMVVHIYGLPVDIDPIISLCRDKDIVLIEDSAEAHGVKYRGAYCGSFGDISTFSFYANKVITTGEGGMVLTSNERLNERIRYFRNLAFAPPPGKRFVHEEIGWNFRLGSMQAALGNSQINRMDEIANEKRKIGLKYYDRLSEHPLLTLQATQTDYSENMYWVAGVSLHESLNTESIAVELKKIGVDTRPFFYPLHKQPLLKNYGLQDQPALPISEKLGLQGIYLPSYIGLSDSDIDYVCESLIDLV